MSQSPVTVVETMHVTSAEDLNNSPDMLLSLPDRDGESYFASYPDTDPVLPPLVAVPDQHVLLDDTPVLDAVAAPENENADDVELPVVYGDDHVLVTEYEYQDFIVPVLRNPRSAVD